MQECVRINFYIDWSQLLIDWHAGSWNWALPNVSTKFSLRWRYNLEFPHWYNFQVNKCVWLASDYIKCVWLGFSRERCCSRIWKRVNSDITWIAFPCSRNVHAIGQLNHWKYFIMDNWWPPRGIHLLLVLLSHMINCNVSMMIVLQHRLCRTEWGQGGHKSSTERNSHVNSQCEDQR